MPAKMSASQVEQKREQILDAAFAVCMRKSMHEVSMRDIITEVGFSQGNIYRYFSNLDEILIELMNRRRIPFDTKAAVDNALSSGCHPEEKIGKMFKIWEKSILDNFLGIGKIYHEMRFVCANDHERLLRIYLQNHTMIDQEYWKEKGTDLVMQNIEKGYFKPRLPLEDIYAFLAASMDGIIRDLILTTHYNVPTSIRFEKDKLIKSLCTAFVLLLGGNEKNIYPQEEMPDDR